MGADPDKTVSHNGAPSCPPSRPRRGAAYLGQRPSNDQGRRRRAWARFIAIVSSLDCIWSIITTHRCSANVIGLLRYVALGLEYREKFAELNSVYRCFLPTIATLPRFSTLLTITVMSSSSYPGVCQSCTLGVSCLFPF
jgi:hypothetical protein